MNVLWFEFMLSLRRLARRRTQNGLMFVTFAVSLTLALLSWSLFHTVHLSRPDFDPRGEYYVMGYEGSIAVDGNKSTREEWEAYVAGQTVFATWSEPLRALATELADGATVLTNGVGPNPVRDVGLAAAHAGLPQLNLLPDEWRERRRKKRVRRVAVRSLIALAAVYVVALLTFLTLLGIKQAQISRVERELASRHDQFTKAQELHKTLLAMQQRLDRERSALEVLREVSQLMPDNVKLTGFNFKRDVNVLLRGQAQAAGFVNDFIGKLEKSAMFTKVTIGQQKIEPGTGLTRFDVDCSLKTTGAAHGSNK